jgi:subtilase family serine protease
VRQAVATGQAKFLNPLPAAQTLRINILLPVRDQLGLYQFLQKLYDPSSPSYRHFLTAPEFTARFGPTQEDYDAVARFAKANGMTVTDLSPNRLVLGVKASVASVQGAFHLRMGVYQHPTEKRTFFAPDREPTVDLDVRLWHIGGLDNFSLPHPLYETGPMSGYATGSGPGSSLLGSDRRAAYYGGTTLTGAGQSVGLFQFDGYNMSDVQAYFSNVGQSLNVAINNVLIDGASGGSDGNDLEQVADIVEAVSMAPGLDQVRVYIGPYSTFTVGVTDTHIFNRMAYDNIAKQLSCSWTWQVTDPTYNDWIFSQMQAQGQSLFVASGDWGSFPNGADPYYYPAEDAHVTAVGGTSLETNGAGGAWVSESAWWASGGGPSQHGVPIPDYQTLSGVINTSNNGSTTLRNVPDVAAEADYDNYYCANGSCHGGLLDYNLAGTSLAAPTWAGYMALANQQEETNYNTSVGFINPLIYPMGLGSGYSTDFHDINDSSSNGTYFAVTGYDLVTGWGSPNGAGLISALTATAPPPPPDFSLSADPTSYTGHSNDSVQFTITVTPQNGFNGTVYFSTSLIGDANGISYYIWPTQVTGSGSTTLYATVTGWGPYIIVVTGQDGNQVHQICVEDDVWDQ